MESGFASAARNSTRSNEDAALTIQRAARGRQARLAYRAKKVAAARIQSRMRGQMARKEVTNRRGGGTTIGGLKETNIMMETQVTQEYTGQGIHVISLTKMWSYYMSWDTLWCVV